VSSIERHILLLERKKAILRARRDLISFTRLMMPDPDHFDDPAFSLYDPQKCHHVIGAALEEVEAERYARLMMIVGPRFGKTTLASSMYPAWYMGRHPDRSIIIATYNENYSWDLGRRIREIMLLPQYRQVFPDVEVKTGAKSVKRIQTTAGGVVFAIGRGSTATGRGAHTLLIDDPIKDAAEANSLLIRDKLWEWYLKVIRTRLMTGSGTIVLIQTRWSDDDLIGRLVDPANPYYTEGEARQWRKIEFPALAEEEDVLGRKVGQSLWPERFSEKYLEDLRSSDPRGFASLYQGRPSPKEGAFFKAADLIPYTSMRDLPPNVSMRFYGACDLAVSLDQKADKSCLMVVGVDEADHLWIMPDLVWMRVDSNGAVEGMLALMDKYRPQFWWAEAGQIIKSIGPFLRKRMLEKRVFCAIDTIAPSVDKQQRAQAIQARSAMGMVHFPQFARWWVDAHDQMLKFPNGTNDDFVDALALVGLGLSKMRPRQRQQPPPEVIEGTFRSMLADTRRKEGREDSQRRLQGWI
jgi:predicted phage terminase large subunit-like protein